MPRSVRDQMADYESGFGARGRGTRLAITVDDRSTKLGWGSRQCKQLNVAVSVIVALSGIAITATGAYFQVNTEVLNIIGNAFSNVIIVFGVFLMLTGMLGITGTVRESKMFLTLFAGLLSVILLALLILSSFALSQSDLNVVGRAWQYISNDEKYAVETNYYCCGFNYPLQYPGLSASHKCPGPDGGLDPYKDTRCNGNDWSQCPVPPCGPMLASDYHKIKTGFAAAGIVIASISILGVLAACCVNRGIDAADERRAQEERDEKDKEFEMRVAKRDRERSSRRTRY